jgi:hypothetical protein
LNWKAGFFNQGRCLGRQQHNAGGRLKDEPDKRDWNGGMRDDRGLAQPAQDLDIKGGDRPDDECRTQHVHQIGERIEPSRAAGGVAEAGMLERQHHAADILGRHARIRQRSSTVFPATVIRSARISR